MAAFWLTPKDRPGKSRETTMIRDSNVSQNFALRSVARPPYADIAPPLAPRIVSARTIKLNRAFAARPFAGSKWNPNLVRCSLLGIGARLLQSARKVHACLQAVHLWVSMLIVDRTTAYSSQIVDTYNRINA